MRHDDGVARDGARGVPATHPLNHRDVLQRLFADDHRDGSLEQMLLSPNPTVLLALGNALKGL